MPIPTDWNGQDWAFHLLCWPDSVEYAGILRGQVTELTRGRYWDEKTGSILATQAIANLIIQNNTDSEGNIMGCADLIATLESINASIRAIENAQIEISVSSESSASSNLELNQNVIALSNSIAISQSWAESMAVSTSSVELINNVALAIGPVSPTQPPIDEQVTLTGITTTPVLSDRYCDAAVYIVDSIIAFWDNFQALTVGVVQITLSVMLGIVAESIAALGLIGLPPIIMPASSTAAVASGLVGWVLEGTLEYNTQQSNDILVSQRESLICLIWEAGNVGDDTGMIRSSIASDLEGAGATDDMQQVLLPLFSSPLMALLYFDSTFVDIPVSGFDCDGLCGV